MGVNLAGRPTDLHEARMSSSSAVPYAIRIQDLEDEWRVSDADFVRYYPGFAFLAFAGYF